MASAPLTRATRPGHPLAATAQGRPEEEKGAPARPVVRRYPWGVLLVPGTTSSPSPARCRVSWVVTGRGKRRPSARDASA